MTVQEVVLDLLRYIGVTGFAPLSGANALNRPGLDTDDINKALSAVNQALQEIQKYGPQSLKEGERAAFLNNPTLFAINVSAITGQSATFPSPPPSWIAGCSILIQGDTDLNRVVDITGNDISLLRGYRGPTATGVSATVYADCAHLQDDITAVVEPVIISPNQPIRKARDITEFMRLTESLSHQTTIGQGYGTTKPVGAPMLWITETRFDGSIYLRFNPMPNVATNATFQAKLAPQRVDVGDLDITGVGTDPASTFNLRDDHIESVLQPLARGKFLSHPALKNQETRSAIREAYNSVMLRLENGSAFETSVAANHVVYI